MKIDFAMLETAAEAGASAKVIIAMLKEQYGRGDAKRKRDKENKIIARAGLGRKRATKGDTERHERNSERDKGRQEATPSDKQPTHIELERAYFARANEICGGRAGAIASSLLKAKGQDLAAATAVLDAAMKTRDPRAYVAGACKGTGNGHHRPSLAEAADDLIDQARALERAAGISRPDEPFGGFGSGEVLDGTVAERKTG